MSTAGVPEGGGGYAPLVFGRSVNPIPIKVIIDKSRGEETIENVSLTTNDQIFLQFCKIFLFLTSFYATF